MNSRLGSPFRAVLAALLFSGCHGPEPARFNHGLGVAEDPVLIVPFSEPRLNRWYAESERGIQLVEALKHWARETWGAEFPEGELATRTVREIRDWSGAEGRIPSAEWQHLTRDLGVKYVVVGEITRFQARDPKLVNLLEATIAVSYRVVDVPAGKIAYQQKELVVQYGNPNASELPILDLGTDPTLIERRVLSRAGQEVGKELYGYYPDSR